MMCQHKIFSKSQFNAAQNTTKECLGPYQTSIMDLFHRCLIGRQIRLCNKQAEIFGEDSEDLELPSGVKPESLDNHGTL